jgi:hypothetical protein
MQGVVESGAAYEWLRFAGMVSCCFVMSLMQVGAGVDGGRDGDGHAADRQVHHLACVGETDDEDGHDGGASVSETDDEST